MLSAKTIMKKLNAIKLLIFSTGVAVIGSMFFLPAFSEITVEKIVLLNENSGWCWFQDERAIMDGDKLLFTGVTSNGANTISGYNMKTGARQTVVVNDETFEADDHNVKVLFCGLMENI